MYSLRSVNVLSCAKMMGAIYGCLGLILLPFFLLAGVATLMSGQDSASLSGAAMLFFAILAPIIYGAMGFVLGALMAWVYNLVARRIGGFQLELKPAAGNAQSSPGLV
ncbi:MAG: hypothetical protein ACLPLR_04850 [Terriglobales bacterium]